MFVVKLVTTERVFSLLADVKGEWNRLGMHTENLLCAL